MHMPCPNSIQNPAAGPYPARRAGCGIAPAALTACGGSGAGPARRRRGAAGRRGDGSSGPARAARGWCGGRAPLCARGRASLRARLARLRSHLCDSPAASALLQALRSPVSRPSRCGVALRIKACRLAEEALCRSATGGPERRSHNSRRKARVARCAGGRERPASLRCGRRAGRGEPRWLPGAGGRGMTRRLRPERGERWASFRRRRQQLHAMDAQVSGDSAITCGKTSKNVRSISL